jgi:protein-tyrosine kinase
MENRSKAQGGGDTPLVAGEGIEAFRMTQTVRLHSNREHEDTAPAGASPSGDVTSPAGPAGDPLAPEAAVEVSPGGLGPVSAASLRSGSLVGEGFRLLRSRVERINEQTPFRCIGMVSATAGEGKTTASLGLAHAFAQESTRRVLLIEADLRKPTLESYLSLTRKPGLGEWLEGARGPCFLRRLPTGLWLLTSGALKARRHELLGSERMASLLAAVRRHFDYAIVDCPPLIPVADSVILQDLLDGFLMVVRARLSPRETILRALSQLKSDRVQGVVFNDEREILSRYHSYGSRQYGDID